MMPGSFVTTEINFNYIKSIQSTFTQVPMAACVENQNKFGRAKTF